MILFKEIYRKAIKLFDDPDIQKAYDENEIRFEKLMYDYLQNGLVLFTDPTAIASQLVNQTPPSGQMEIIDGENTATYALTMDRPPVNAEVIAMIAGVVDTGATYKKDDNSITFSREVPMGTECSVEWYFCGQFNTDFSGATSSTVSADFIASRVKDILARCLVLCWAEENENYILEIRNILTDTDFKIHAPSNAVRSKIEWVKHLHWELDTMRTKLGWNLYSRSRGAGRYYGN